MEFVLIVLSARYSCKIYYSEHISTEIKKILIKKFKYSDDTVNELLYFINKFFIKCKTSEKIKKICRDTKDGQLIADAIYNNIEIIVSGDKDLQVIKEYCNIKIFSPQEFKQFLG